MKKLCLILALLFASLSAYSQESFWSGTPYGKWRRTEGTATIILNFDQNLDFSVSIRNSETNEHKIYSGRYRITSADRIEIKTNSLDDKEANKKSRFYETWKVMYKISSFGKLSIYRAPKLEINGEYSRTTN